MLFRTHLLTNVLILTIAKKGTFHGTSSEEDAVKEFFYSILSISSKKEVPLRSIHLGKNASQDIISMNIFFRGYVLVF